MSDLLCHGCLSSGRKLQFLNDYLKTQSFFQILSEKQICPPNKTAVSICWECEALLTRFIKFKKQVQYSYSLLNDYVANKINLSHIEKQSKLKICKVNYRDIIIHDETEIVEEIKLENDVLLYDKDELKIEDPTKEEFIVPLPLINDNDVDDEFDYSEGEEYKEEIVEKKSKRGRPKKILNGVNVKNGKKKKKKKPKAEQESTEVSRMITLTAAQIEEERRVLAASDIYANSNIKCDKCILAFANVDDLNDHFSSKHNLKQYKYKCDICQCVFASDMSYNYHKNKHYRRYRCILCDVTLPTQRSVVRHYDITHSTVSDTYLGELDNFTEHKESQNEMQEETSNKDENNDNGFVTYPCELCDKVFKWKTSLVKHAEMHRIQTGEKRKPFCEPCRLTFTTTSNLQKHCKTSSKHQIQLQLNKLPNPSDARIDAIKQDVVSGRSRFPCPHCDKRFQWRGNLLRHLHSLEARAKGHLHCAPCSRSFSSIATYNQHMKLSKKHITEDEFKYTCNDCGKKYSSKTLLKDHVDWEHLKNFVHKCSVCDKVFKSHTSLYLHKKMVHRQDNGGHLCDHCGRSFPNHNKLRTHITALHTAEQPYKCRLCTATFSWHSCLSRHVKVVHHKVKVKRKVKTVDDNIQ